jgi:hypothetical protein
MTGSALAERRSRGQAVAFCLSQGSFCSRKEIRAMDRRRYVPSPEGLETRTMMSTTTTGSLFRTSATTSQPLPITFQQKTERIEKVPLNLRALQPNRYLPPDTIHQIQLGLFEIIDGMGKPPSSALTSYNLAMRRIVFNSSLSKSRVDLLNHSFTGVLRVSNTPEPGLTTLATAVNQLISQVDTASVNPAFLGANDNAYLLQLAIVLGQPMPAPRTPTIAKTSGAQINPRVSVTPLSNPTFVGTYEYGTTMQMMIVSTNEVIGSAIVAKNGQYSLRITTPLPVGKYNLAVRAVDEVGHISHASRVFGLKVVPPKHHHTAQQILVGQPTPAGPLVSTTTK